MAGAPRTAGSLNTKFLKHYTEHKNVIIYPRLTINGQIQIQSLCEDFVEKILKKINAMIITLRNTKEDPDIRLTLLDEI